MIHEFTMEYEHLLLDYLDTFDLDTYLEFIQENKNSQPKFSLLYITNRDFLGFDFAAQLSETFKEIGIEQSNFLGMLDGNESSMHNFVQDLCIHLNKRQKLEKVEAHVLSRNDIIGDSLLDFLICGIVESINYHGWETPNSFVILMFARNNILNGKALKEFRKTLKQTAAIKAWGSDPNASIGKISKVIGINKATLSRWISEDKNFTDVLEYRLNFNEEKFMKLLGSLVRK